MWQEWDLKDHEKVDTLDISVDVGKEGYEELSFARDIFHEASVSRLTLNMIPGRVSLSSHIQQVEWNQTQYELDEELLVAA